MTGHSTSEYNKNWYLEHREHCREYHREHYLKNRVRILKKCKEYRVSHKEQYKDYIRHHQLNSRIIKISKRRFYGICELCGKEILNRPYWHHWNDKHPERGLWLHGHCHQTVEVAEKNSGVVVIPLYEKIKELIENEYKN